MQARQGQVEEWVLRLEKDLVQLMEQVEVQLKPQEWVQLELDLEWE
jgi:hypothetical protein